MSPPQKPFPCPQKKKKNIEANNLEHLHPIFKIMFSFITIFPLASLGKIQPRGTNKKKHGETFPWENKFRGSNFTSPKPQLPAESLLPLLARRAPQNSWVTMAALVTFRSANSLRWVGGFGTSAAWWCGKKHMKNLGGKNTLNFSKTYHITYHIIKTYMIQKW